jgi:DNA-binding MarR family transcriptional regulator
MKTLAQAREEAIDRFWETVPPLWGRIRLHIRSVATERFDIGVEQFHVLRCVQRGPGSMSELASAKNISRPAISQAADALELKGYVRRAGRPADRRYVELELTKTGQELLEAVFGETRSWMRDKMSSLTLEELETISRAMPALQKMVEQPKAAGKTT